MANPRLLRLSDPVLAGIGGIPIMLVIGALAGQDFNWDLLNYHYASAHLFLAGEYRRNVAPSGLQSWFNPIGYVPAYLAIARLSPRVASMLFATVAGLNAPLIFLVATRVAEDLPTETRSRVGFACTAIGITGAITLGEAGTSFLDNILSIVALGGILIVLAATASADPSRQARSAALSGLLFGAICGLKLTCAVLAAGLAAALAVMVIARRLPPIVLPMLALGGLFGFLVTGGWWAWRLWAEFGNPVFPLFNNVFRSPSVGLQPLVDTNFLPKSWSGAVTFPWHWLLGDVAVGAEIIVRDPRYAVSLLGSIVGIGSFAARRPLTERASNNAALLVELFFLFSYLVWLFTFAILRYVVVLEMLSGIVLLAALRSVPRLAPTATGAAMIVAAFAILVWTRPATWGRVPFTSDWFGVQGVASVHRPGTVYVLPDGAPLAFLIPAFPADARFVRIGGTLPLTPGFGLGSRVAAILRSSPQLRTLAAAPIAPEAIAALGRFGLVPDPNSCRIITTKAAAVESCRLTLVRRAD